MTPLITLTTDFGLEDAYVGAMRGVILGICPEARLVDISHHLPRQDVAHAALVLRDSVPYFPSGTVHVAVIDPGVGTARKAVAIECGGHRFVGPDNGLFGPVLEALGGPVVAHEVTNPDVLRKTISATFHGRDVFSPTGAHLAAGVALQALGPPVEALVDGGFWAPPQIEPGCARGVITDVDHFGNLRTNIPIGALGAAPSGVTVRWPAHDHLDPVEGLQWTYGQAPQGALLVLVGSSGHVEVAVNHGSAAQRLGLAAGAQVEVHWNA